MSSTESGKYGIFKDIPNDTGFTDVNSTDFTALAFKGRTGPDGLADTGQHSASEAHGRKILTTRFRSGSITESHFDGSGETFGQHRAYHWSPTGGTGSGQLSSVRSNRSQNVRKQHIAKALGL